MNVSPSDQPALQSKFSVLQKRAVSLHIFHIHPVATPAGQISVHSDLKSSEYFLLFLFPIGSLHRFHSPPPQNLSSAFTFTVPASPVCPRPPGISAPSFLSDCSKMRSSYPAEGFRSHCPDLFTTSLVMQEINVYSKQGKI